LYIMIYNLFKKNSAYQKSGVRLHQGKFTIEATFSNGKISYKIRVIDMLIATINNIRNPCTGTCPMTIKVNSV